MKAKASVRKIHSAIPIYLCAAVWILFGLALPLYMGQYILMCAGLSLAVYLIGGRLFPGREVQVELPPDTGDAELNRQITEGRKAITALRQANEDIPSPVVSAQLDRMEKAGLQIFEAIERNARKALQVRKFMNYYLPTSVKLLNHYRALQGALTGENVETSIKSIESSLDMIAAAFEKQLDNLYRDEVLDITTDIQVLETMLAGEGLVGDQRQTVK